METKQMLADIITKDKVDEAFQKIKHDAELAIPGYEYVLLREEWHDRTIDLFRDHYFPYEPLSLGIGLKWNDELESILKSQVQQNLSLAIVSQTDRTLVSGLIMVITNKNSTINAHAKENRTWYRFNENLENEYNIYQHYNVEEAIDFAYACTHKDFRRRGFGSMVTAAGVCFIKNLGISCIVIHVIASWKTSQWGLEKLGFNALAEIIYANYIDNGEAVCKHMLEHKSAKFYAKVIL